MGVLDFDQPGFVVISGGVDPVTKQAIQGGTADLQQTTNTNLTANNANQAAGTPTANSTVSIATNGKSTASLEVTANTLGAAITAQGSIDNVNWFTLGPLPFLNQATGVWSATIPTGATGIWTIGVADVPYFRLTTPTSGVTGSATVRLNASNTQAIVTAEPLRYQNARATADLQAKAGPGVLHALSVAGLLASPTAGLLTIYDSLTETGTVLWSEWVPATVIPHTIVLDLAFTTGLFIGFDATLANINAQVSYL
jgi:hypothetical protein